MYHNFEYLKLSSTMQYLADNCASISTFVALLRCGVVSILVSKQNIYKSVISYIGVAGHCR